MRNMIIMLENDDTRYEFYMAAIKESNVSDKIARWELRYDRIHSLVLGSEVSFSNRLVGVTFEQMISNLLLKGFKPVTFETKKFA